MSFVASVSGEYSISNAAKISLDLGVSLGASDTYELNTGFSVNVPQGKRVMIKYRPAYYRVKVTETEYWEAFIIGGGWQSFEMGTKVSYVNVFSHWDYDAVELTD